MGRRVERALQCLLDEFGRAPADDSLRPHPFSYPRPSLFVASSTPRSVELVARQAVPLLHYLATPIEARVALIAKYAEFGGGASPPHVHALVLVIADDEAKARERLCQSLERSFRDGDRPALPQSANRHVGADGKPADRTQMAAAVANAAIVGSPQAVVDRLSGVIARLGPARYTLYLESIGEQAATLESLERFATEVMPHIRS